MLHVFFWVIPRRLNFICRRFGTLCLFHLHKRVGMKNDQVSEMLGYFTGRALARKSLNQYERGLQDSGCFEYRKSL